MRHFDHIRLLPLYAVCTLAFVFLVLPLLVIVMTSFTQTAYLAFPPQGFTLRWYRQFLGDQSYLQSIWLSV